MGEPIVSKEIDTMAEEVLELSQLAAKVRAQMAKGTAGLTEPEFLALDALVKEQPMTVGEIQKAIGVLPAQMSRVLRSLEKHDAGQPLVECRINPNDRRRVDVALSEAGRNAHKAYRRGRLSFICDFLANIDPDHRVIFMKIIHDFHARILDRIKTG